MIALAHLRICTAHPADAEAVTACFLAARHAGMPFLPLITDGSSIHAWMRQIVLPRPDTWIAERDGAVVGLLALLGDHVEHLSVHPQVWGQGVGSSLVAFAKRRSPQGLYLHTFQRNERARRFYEARGFVPVATSDGRSNQEREPDVTYQWPGRASAA